MTPLTDRLKTALANRYVTERELGSGGMATVYLAHDIKHDRKVAIKVMRPELSAILGGERFLREVSIAAKLNHPHILALHDSGQAEEFLYYVMPYVEGESLRAKLDREKQLSVDEAISIIKQVGAALDYAHEQGVIHRDIKPENILIHQGEALVSDFGIALAVTAAGGTRLTDTGLSLGTPEYMSPEQATAERELDARSDVYSLGAVTYEMLVGEPPHTGNTVQAIIAKVVSAEPQPVSRVRATVPVNVDAAVQCALAKAPVDRFASGAELSEALANPAFQLPTRAGLGTAPEPAGAWKQLTLLFAALTAVLVMTTLWAMTRTPSTPPIPVARVSILMPEGEEVITAPGTDIALSRDGARLVYVGPFEGGRRLWLRPLDQLHATPIPGTEGAMGPFFSPDGETVAFFAGAPTSLKVVSVAGSPPVTLTDSVRGNSGDWGPDRMLYFQAEGSRGISRVPATGGEHEVMTVPNSAHGEHAHDRVDVLPNGKGALFTIWRGVLENAEVAVVEFETGEVHVLARGLDPQYAPSGHVVYVRSDNVLVAAPFDQDRLVLSGQPTPLVEGVYIKSAGAAQFALSETGILLCRVLSRPQSREAVWVDRRGAEHRIDPGWADLMSAPALSRDDQQLAISVAGPDGEDIWIKTLEDGPLSRLTFEGAINSNPEWTADGLSVTFMTDRTSQGSDDLWIKRSDGVGSGAVLLDLAGPVYEGFLSPDSAWLIYQTEGDIFASRAAPDSVTVALATGRGAIEATPALSRDGRWLAYVSDETGRWEVWVRPFPDVEAGRWQISVQGGTEPVWAHSGRELFYKNGNQELAVVEVATEPTFRVVQERALFSVSGYYSYVYHQQYAVSTNDQRFLMLRQTEQESSELVLVLNFFDELRRLVGNGSD